MANFLTTPVPHSDGADYIRNKPAVTRAIFDALSPELQAKAFVITGVEALDVVARVRDLVAQLPEGGDYDDLKDEILKELTPWFVKSTDPLEQAKQQAAANRRAELLLRMHGWQAYARTQDAMIRANADVFPFSMYLSSEDSRVRPSHAALNKKIVPTDHPFWHNHTPPWEFGCRCDKVPMSAEEVDEIRADEAAKPVEDRQVLDAAQLGEIERNGRIVKPSGQGFLDIRTPRERTGNGYEWRPAEDALSIDQILARYTPAERSAFEDFAANQKLDDGRTLLDWWKPAKRFAENDLPLPPGGAPKLMDLAKAAIEGEAVQALKPGPVDLMPAPAKALVETREDSIRHLAVEHGSLFDADGSRVDFTGTGNAISVAAAVETAGRIFTHVHPGGRSFSPEDIEQLFVRRLAEVRVVTRAGNYSVHPVDGVRLAAVMDRLREIAPDIAASLALLAEKRSPREIDVAAEHLAWSALAKEGLIYYSYTPMRAHKPILDALSAMQPTQEIKDDGTSFYSPPLEEVRAFWQDGGAFPGLEAVLERIQQAD